MFIIRVNIKGSWLKSGQLILSSMYITCSNSINKVIFFKPDNLTNLNRVYFKVTINDLRVLKSNLL